MNKNKGFTLIELLVVIAIIGILSSVVLASLNTARNKGNDAAIKNNLANMRPQAEMYYDTNNNYGGAAAYYSTDGTCITAGTGVFSDTTIRSGLASAKNASGSNPICSITANGAAWAVAIPLKGTPANYWCVDSTGASKESVGANPLPASGDATC